jgi:hypothetical protein
MHGSVRSDTLLLSLSVSPSPPSFAAPGGHPRPGAQHGRQGGVGAAGPRGAAGQEALLPGGRGELSWLRRRGDSVFAGCVLGCGLVAVQSGGCWTLLILSTWLHVHKEQDSNGNLCGSKCWPASRWLLQVLGWRTWAQAFFASHTPLPLIPPPVAPAPALQSQQRAAGGFMYQAVSTLRMLNTLTAHPEVQRSFLQQPIAGRAANAVSQSREGEEGAVYYPPPPAHMWRA